MNEQLPFDGRVAIVGLALRAPGASTIQEFWSNLLAGLVSGLVPDPLALGSDMHPRQIQRIKEFDRHLFNMQPAETVLTDPQQRVFLELVWEAFEDAGIDPHRFEGRIGVFAGCGRDDYRRRLLDKNPEFELKHGRQQIEIGNERDYFATNIAYRFDLKGSSFTIQSACSTSLVAIHVAARSLLTGECDLAIAGGLTIQLPDATYRYQEGDICSMDRRCRPFTNGSDGTVPASGGGAVILARAGDIDGHKLNPYAYIVGTAANNDGRRKMNFAAPAVGGHVTVITEALDFAGLAPEQIGFVQAHGTGTRLGDEIELTALQQTYGRGRPATKTTERCAVGSIKANIGHADAGAGVLGLITCALALNKRVIPPTPNQPGDGTDVLSPNEESRLFTPRVAIPWNSETQRRAAVSSLGVGGTNAHVVLEEVAERRTSTAAEDRPTIFALSAVTPLALRNIAERLLPCLEDKAVPVASIASTLWYGRSHLGYRWATAIGAGDNAADKLKDIIAKADDHSPFRQKRSPKLAVLLPGQGVVIDDGYAELLASSPAFRLEFNRLGEAIIKAGGPDIGKYERIPAGASQLSDTEFIQPLLFALQLSLLRSLRVNAANPAIIVGYSLGEFIAAIFGGLLDDEEAAAAVVMRAKLMAAAPDGAMVAARVSDAEVQQLCSEFDLEIAAKLSSSLSVLAGAADACDALIDTAAMRNFSVVSLPVRKAFHSKTMEAAAAEFTRFLSSFNLRPPSVEVASNFDGYSLHPAVATDPQYWGSQIRRCVNLRSAIDVLVSSSPTGILDLGPGDALTNLVRERVFAPGEEPAFFTLAPTRARKSGHPGLDALALAWCAGFDLDLPVAKLPIVRLPTYPFDSTPYWPEASKANEVSSNYKAEAGGDIPNLANHVASDKGSSEISIIVHRIWSEAFGRDDVREEDDFFEVGGTSIHATQILRRVKTECGVKIRLHDLYDYPVLGEFSRYVEDRASNPEQQ